jgi:flagellar basal body-associated protein FliL
MDKLLFWLGIGAAQEAAGSKEEPKDRRHRVISIIVGILLALLISAGAFILLVSQQ